MRLRKCCMYSTLAGALAALAIFAGGCGGNSGAIATTVSVSSSVGQTLILNQSTTITAAVTGPSNVDVTWGGGSSNTAACTYTTTTFSTNGTPTTAKALPCLTDGSMGVLSNEQTTGTATFAAPGALPDPTTFPGLAIIITACSVAQTNKCGSVTLTIDSGVGVTLTPGTAAVPTNEKQPFFAVVANDLKNQGVTYLLTQQTPTTSTTTSNTNIYASLTTCTVAGNASGCGSIDSTGVYTAPSAVPTVTTPAYTSSAPTDCSTPQDVTLVATSVEDPTRFAIGTIAITQGGAITFNGISPTLAPQGAAYWDIFLNAPNMSSASQITLTDSFGGVTPLNSASGQVKITFPPQAPVTTTTTTTSSCPTGTTTTTSTPLVSTGARIRLTTANLSRPNSAAPGPYNVTVAVSDAGEPVTTCTGSPLPTGCSAQGTFTYTVVPVRPTATSSSPNSIIQNTAVSQTNNVTMTVDGGYFGGSGQNASVSFQGTPLVGTVNSNQVALSFSKQLLAQFPTGTVNTGLPGLYPLQVSYTNGPFALPSQNVPTILDLAVFPGYALDPPQVISSGTVMLGANTNPSAIDIDPILGVAVVAETGANAVQFYTIGTGSLTPLGGPVPVGNTPTGLSVNRTNHTVAVVNYTDQTVTVLPIPGAPVQAPGTPFTFSLAGVLQGAVTPAPLPYSIGVDPDTNFGVVAYSSTSSSSIANLGFLVDLNPNGKSVCLQFSGAPSAPPCAFAQVTLNTGAFPQVAMAPHGHLAFVSPGGNGTLHGIDVTKPSSVIGIQSLTVAAGIVTVTTTACNTSTLSPSQFLFPGNSGTVLITGVPTTNAAGNVNFNGVYAASALSDTSFTYIIANNTASGTVTIPNVANPCPPPTTGPVSSTANVYFNSPNLTLGGVSPTAQGIAINPITNTAALADANATGSNGSQIDMVNSLDQSISNIAFTSLCTFYSTSCSNAAEQLGTANIAWQPYSNAIVSYNPGVNVNQVSVSDPTSERRYALACEIKAGAPAPCITNPGVIQNNANQSECAPPNNNVTACTQIYQNQVSLAGSGETTISVNNGTTGKLTLFGGLAVDAATNQAFVVMSGSNQIDIIDLGPCKSANGCADPFNNLKPVEISEVLVPTPASQAGIQGAIGGIPGAAVTEGTLVSSTDLAGVQIFGTGFDASSEVRLDGNVLPSANVTFVSSRELLATIPASPYLSFPHIFALDVITPDLGNVLSNPTDFYVIQAVDMTVACAAATPGTQHPSSVAIADQLGNGPFQPIAVVTNSGCNNVSIVDINPTITNQSGVVVQNPGFGSVIGSVAVGNTPEGVAISQPLGLAVVANNGDGTASVINLLTNTLAAPSVSTGTNPTGVGINNETGAALVTDTGNNNVTELDLASLFGTGAVTTLTPVSAGGVQQPTAVAVDPDRGTNNTGIAVVTSLQLQSGVSLPTGVLEVVDIGTTSPAPSTTLQTGGVTAPATGIVFDPTVITGTQNNGVFYASSSGGNVINAFNPDSGSVTTANVGINPTALAINTETGAIITTNVAGNTTSLVDTTSSPMHTVQTIGLPGSPLFGIAIDQFTNLAVIVDQGNNRLLILPASK